MTPRLHTLTGAMTTVLFLGVGLSLINTPDAERIGALLCGLGVFRGVMLVRSAWPSEPEDDDDDSEPA